MRLEVSRKASQAFLKDRDIDPPDKLKSVVDIVNENPRAGAAFLLRPIRRGQVQISFCRAVRTEGERGNRQKKRDDPN